MALSEHEDIYLRKRESIGGGSRVPPRHDMRTSPERRWILKQRDKARYRTTGRKL